MSSIPIWTVILSMAVLTYGLRVTFLVLHERLTLPPIVSRGLRYVPFAIFAGLIVPNLITPGDIAAGSVAVERIVAGLIGAFIAWRTGSVLWTLLAGMGLLWLLQLL